MAIAADPLNSSRVAMLREQIDARLAGYVRGLAGAPERLVAAIGYSLLAPGKRLRPLIVLLANEACGGRLEEAWGAACAVEMIHTYSLVHDDLPAMDDDELRRGRPTCHIQFDEATAILAGDALLTQAFEVLSVDVRPAETAIRCIQVLATAAGACHLIGGQSADLDAENRQLTIDELESIHSRKTAALFSAAAYLGGATAGVSAGQAAHMAEFGRLLGLSFQIVDDVLDVVGRADDLGKLTRKDKSRGKSTYPQRLGVDASRARARELIDLALAKLADFGPSAEGLRTLTKSLVDRTR
jgi:geranylgeranyl diphosphate synthase type II